MSSHGWASRTSASIPRGSSSVNADDLAFTLLEPEAGLLRAREGVRALADRAVAAGAQRVTAVARPDGERVVLDDGRVLEADHVVWACGAWMAALFGDVLQLRITHQDVYYFGADGRWAAPGVPGWVDFDGAAYGMGDLDGRGVKVGPDVEGPGVESLAAERRNHPSSSTSRARTWPIASPRWRAHRSWARASVSTR